MCRKYIETKKMVLSPGLEISFHIADNIAIRPLQSAKNTTKKRI